MKMKKFFEGFYSVFFSWAQLNYPSIKSDEESLMSDRKKLEEDMLTLQKDFSEAYIKTRKSYENNSKLDPH